MHQQLLPRLFLAARAFRAELWRSRPILRILASLLLTLLGAAAQGDFQGATRLMPFEEDTIGYNQGTPNDAITRLREKLDNGKLQLRHEPKHGYLLSLLDALGIPAASQVLVFSKTSLQRERISPHTPRALFFNDDVYVGFIPGAPLLEISTADPKLGGVFYTLEQGASDKPKITRHTQCLECHASAKSMGVPGHLVRSFETDDNGVVDMLTGTSLVNHRTPLAERWGGWYVTGKHGAQAHRGNLAGPAAFERHKKEPNFAGNLMGLRNHFDVLRYPDVTSDIVALMVLEHQTHMHNFLTRLQFESTLALEQYGHLKYLRNIVDSFMRYLLFVDEAPLAEPIVGAEKYKAWFESQGPHDAKGRSLRELDLKTRMFKYPCSYLVYSPAFEGLPAELKSVLFSRLQAILDGRDPNPDFQKLTPNSRQSIREILLATRPGLWAELTLSEERAGKH